MGIGYIATMIVGAVVLLGICIFVHELGHLLGGKMVGIKARVFSLGYGKGVLKKKFGDTTYQVTLIPFGGYCQFYGDDPTEERKGESFEFLSAHPIKRIVPVVMGPLFNLFLGILIFFMLNLFGYMKESSRITLVDEFQTDTRADYVSPASKAGIRTGDRIVEIAGNRIVKFSDIQQVVFFSEGKSLPVKVQRGREFIQTTVNPENAGSQGRYSIGVMPYIKGIRAAGVQKGGAAETAGLQAGDIINTIDGVRAHNPMKFTEYIKLHPGKKLPFVIVRNGSEMQVDVIPGLREEISIQQIKDSKISEEDRVTLGNAEIAALKNDIAAGKVKVNGTVVNSYQTFLGLVESTRSDIITIEQGATVYKGQARYKSYGFIGIETGVVEDMVEVRFGFGESLKRAFVEPYDFIMMNMKGIGMLFSGKLNVRENLSGPIFIAKIAGDVAYYRGLSSFILLMAQISIILMVMNLLPIPMVDGSYIVLFLLEAVRGKPLSDKVMEKIQFVGMALLILLGVFVIFNDIARIFNFM